MKRFFLYILALFLIFTNLSSEAAVKSVEKEIHAQAKDGFNIRATLSYPKVKGQKDFKTVMLLHSRGYNSQWWGNLPQELLDKGYAVLAIDLRGHGESVYNSKLSKVSWKSLTDNGYAKYPTDIISIVDKIKEEYPKLSFFNNWAIIGADIGASAGIIASDKLKNRPQTIVMMSPVVKTKSLYIPVNIAHLDSTDILTISGTDDYTSQKASVYLSKFAQAGFQEYISASKTTGMLMIKNDPEMIPLLVEWVSLYLK